uniref:Uncharacterized protein n=1 Tax=viral metagenome TaxID=1070528 RepID=A0A6C0L925_9ZZZZ
MSDKTTVLRAFNTHFFEFLDDLLRVFPDNKEISYAKTSFETIKRANPRAIIKSWYNFVFLPYKDVIDNGNITFFIDKDYCSDLSHLNKSEEIMKMIDNIRKPIREMDETNKTHALKYVQNLSKLSDLYHQ